MPTLNSVLMGALKLAGVVGEGQTPAAYVIADALHSLNLMTDLWSSQGVFFPTRETLAVTSGVSSYTIGTGGVFNTSRPVSVRDSHILIGTQEYPVKAITHSQYEGIGNKALTGRPYLMHMLPTMPTGTIKLFPVPDANYSLILVSLKPIPTYTTASLPAATGLPPGFDMAIEYGLAMIVAAQKGRTLSQPVYSIADSAYNNIVNQCAAYRLKNMTGLDPTGKSGNDFPVGWLG